MRHAIFAVTTLLACHLPAHADDSSLKTAIVAEEAGNWETIVQGQEITLRTVSGEALLGVTPAEDGLYLLASTPHGGQPAVVDLGDGNRFVLSPIFVANSPQFEVLISDSQSRAFIHALTSGREATISVGPATYSVSLTGSSSAIEALSFFGKEHGLNLPPPFSSSSLSASVDSAPTGNGASNKSTQQNGQGAYIRDYVDTEIDGRTVTSFKLLHPLAHCDSTFCDGFSDTNICPHVGLCSSYSLIISNDRIAGWTANFGSVDWSKSFDTTTAQLGRAIEDDHPKNSIISMSTHLWTYKLADGRALVYARYTGKNAFGDDLNNFTIMLEPPTNRK